MHTRHPDAPQRARHPENLTFNTNDEAEHFVRWQAHLDAGRIGNPASTDPAIGAQRERNDALFRERAARRDAEARADSLARYLDTVRGGRA